ncbi:calcium-binding protein [Sinorhizobium fredii]|uniref:calcium-binding protein n=1 Tax=Rhizobium fredii TaxID=380 RepID=UPI00351434F4
MTTLSDNTFSIQQIGAKNFKVTDTTNSKTYTIESDIIPSGIDLSNATTRHFYVSIDGGLSTSALGGSASGMSRVKGNTWENPAPIYWWDLAQGSDIETTGSTTNTIGPGGVTHIRDSLNDEFIVNVTTDDNHPLYPGFVVRIPIERDGKFYIASIGVGNGDLGDTNNAIAKPIWSHNANNILEESIVEYLASSVGVALRDMRNSASETISIIVDTIRDKFNSSLTRGSPLVLDLVGAGVDLVSSNGDDAVYWNHKLDGFAYASGWVGAGMGLLAMDHNQDGMINDSSELFGTANGEVNGFIALSSYDSNGDQKITAEDVVWNDLIVWVDENGDGFSQADEMESMDDLLITEISLSYTDVNYTINGNAVFQEGTFVIDGNTHEIVDAYFAYDTVNSAHDDRVEYGYEVFSLPLLRGYGTLADLHIANTLDGDSQDAESLVSLVTDFTDLEASDIFAADTVALDAVRAIMCRWAGVDDLTGSERGSFVDSRELGFLEAMMGTAFVQRDIYSDPQGIESGEDLNEAFHLALNHIYARLVVQSAGGALFEGDWYYNIATDSFVGVTGLDSAVLNDLETEATSLANTAEREIFWSNVLRAIEFSVGVNNLPGGDQTALEDAIYDSDNSLDMGDLITGLDYVREVGVTETGTSGNDTMNGSSSHDTLSGGYGDDTINGLAGNDTINGGDDDDIMTGGTGGDYIRGNGGDDRYIYNAGDGDDTYEESATGTGHDDDRIVFGAGIDINDLTLTRMGNTDLVIDIDNGTHTGRIIIEDQFNFGAGGGYIELLEFSDTSTFDLTNLAWIVNGTAGNDVLNGVTSGNALTTDTIYGGAGNDTINGKDGNDTLYGEAGNDTLKGEYGDDALYGGDGNDLLEGGDGEDTLSGGAGNDTLRGGVDDDTYIYTGGNDTIDDQGGTEELQLDAAWNGITPHYLRSGNDLTLWFDEDNTIKIVNHYGGKAVESMVYANLTTVNLTTVSTVTMGDSGNNTIGGTANDDVIFGEGGNDTLNGASGSNGNDTLYGGTGDDTLGGGYGNDWLDGGSGDDTLRGHADDDTYVYTTGHDYFDESGGDDLIIFHQDWSLSELTFRRYINGAGDLYDLFIEIDANNSIQINNQFHSAGKVFETIRLAGIADIDVTAMTIETHGSSSGETISGISTGASVDDIIYGWGGNDTLRGYAGNDTIYGGDGNDTLEGGDGDDLLYGEAGDDLMRGFAGNDTFVYEEGLDTVEDLHAGTDTLWITGGRTVNDLAFSNSGTYHTKITLTATVDEIIVNNLRHGTSTYHVELVRFDDGFQTSLVGYNGWLNGTSGNDMVAGNANDNTLIGFAGNDSMTGGAGNDAMHGGAGNDTVEGEDGDDLLYGGDGDDTLYGGAGLDTMHGGAGADIFVFELASAFSNVDVIRDFSVGDDDVIDLTDILDTVYDPLTDAIADFVQFTESSGNTFVEVDRDGTGSTYSFAQIAKLEGVTNLASPELLETNGNLLAA